MGSFTLNIGQEVCGQVSAHLNLRAISQNGARYAIMKGFVMARVEPSLFHRAPVRKQNVQIAFRDDPPFREPRIETYFRARIGPPLGNEAPSFKPDRHTYLTLTNIESGYQIPISLIEDASPYAGEDFLTHAYRRVRKWGLSLR